MIKDKINELLVDITKFWLEFEPEHRKRMISSGEMLRNRPTTMTYPQLMTIVVSFHMSGYRNFKTYYFEYLKIHCLVQNLTQSVPPNLTQSVPLWDKIE
jgi:hypothetical protein